MVSDLSERDLADREKATLHQQLLEASRRAGMADMATGVLHNVGNVLNSINVSTNCMSERLENTYVKGLIRASDMLSEHARDLSGFLLNSEKGKRFPGYLAKLSLTLSKEREILQKELAEISRNVDHVNQIVAAQQSFGRVFGVEVEVDPVEVLEAAIQMTAAGFARHDVDLVREYPSDLPTLKTDKHKVMQILVNILNNAKNAVESSEVRQVTASIRCNDDGTLSYIIRDSGQGILEENLDKIFTHGFTTRPDGHGFGLHSSALAARELGGTLFAESKGQDCGAEFTLSVPGVECLAVFAEKQGLGTK
ncbi:MAG: hypothetical protein Fues2KO_04570 [Fuerstiella sp.]